MRKNLFIQEDKSVDLLDKFQNHEESFYFVPEMSIIIPVYEEEKIFPKVLSNYTNELLRKYRCELIISDGGSKDKTIEIARKFTNKVVVHNSDKKQTIAEGRNRGAEIATGKVLIFLNGDTVPENPEKFFEYISKWAEKDKSHIALAVKVRPFPEEEIFKDKLFYFCHNNYVRLLNLIGIGMGRGECQIVRRDAFWRVGGYNPQISAGEDFDLYHRLAKIGKIKYVDELCVFESPRRFRKYGYLRTIIKWLLNGIFVLFFGRSFSNHWEPVR